MTDNMTEARKLLEALQSYTSEFLGGVEISDGALDDIANAIAAAEKRGREATWDRAINTAKAVREFINLDETQREDCISEKYWFSTRAISEVIAALEKKRNQP